jgi:hypothetical protein
LPITATQTPAVPLPLASLTPTTADCSTRRSVFAGLGNFRVKEIENLRDYRQNSSSGKFCCSAPPESRKPENFTTTTTTTTTKKKKKKKKKGKNDMNAEKNARK